MERPVIKIKKIVGVVAGGLFNAIAFAGAGYVFHKLDKNGYEKEMRRHNKAIERFEREKEKWYEKTVEKKNKIALLRQEVQDANKDFKDVNEAFRKLRLAIEDLEGHEDVKPKKYYYEPSEKMKMYMTVVTGVVGSVSGFLATKLLF